MALFRSKKKLIKELIKDNARLAVDNEMLRNLCNEKDSYFKELMADGLRHGSSLAAQHMADRKSYLRKK